MAFEIKPATRTGIRLLIAPYSESGCGKTYSSLLLARGLAGPTGKIVVADSESGRASLYADVIPGGFETFDLGEPFSPARYIEAVSAIEASGAAVGIIDSGSHEWEGISGVLDMAADNEQRSGKPGLHNWKTPKLEHAKFVQRLLRSKIHLIVCLRAKHKSRQTKDERGKTVIIKDDHTSPIQAEDFIFEATVHMEIMPDHGIRLTKISHPTLGTCFEDGKPITIATGEALAKWCSAPGTAPAARAAAKPADELTTIKRQLWELTKDQHHGDKAAFRQWLVDEALIDPAMPVEDLKLENLKAVLNEARKKLQEPGIVP